MFTIQQINVIFASGNNTRMIGNQGTLRAICKWVSIGYRWWISSWVHGYSLIFNLWDTWWLLELETYAYATQQEIRQTLYMGLDILAWACSCSLLLHVPRIDPPCWRKEREKGLPSHLSFLLKIIQARAPMFLKRL